MLVALDTHPLYTSRAGVARYLTGLRSGLRTECPDISVQEIVWPVENFGYAQPERVLKTAWRELGWANFVAPALLAKSGADLFHSPALPIVSRTAGRPHVVTLHDLALMRNPERFRSWQRRSGLARLRKVVAAKHVICVSRFTADEAMQLLEIPAGRLTVVENGVTTLPAGGALPAGCPAEFLLFVGSLERGKNLELLRAVWRAAAEDGKALPPLVVLGERWRGVGHEGVAPANWFFVGRQDDATLAACYHRARGLVFPSRYEGFGLPVAEALQCGCPVICGAVASLPEVGGEAVLYADLTVPGFRAAIERLLSEPGLAADLASRGREQAKRFSWPRCARETAEVWRQVTA